MANPFAPPGVEVDRRPAAGVVLDDPVRARARKTLDRTSALPVLLGLLQFWWNPLFAVTVATVVASVSALRTPDVMRRTAGEDYPVAEGKRAKVGGVVGLLLVLPQVAVVVAFLMLVALAPWVAA